MKLSGMIARLIAFAWCFFPLLAQQPGFEPVRSSLPVLVRPYVAPAIPPVRLSNVLPMSSLMRAGILYLKVQDALALALANNIDLEVARYNPVISQWNLERSQAGGALPGVPSGASQVGSVASGQGVSGSQSAAGVTTGFAGVTVSSAASTGIAEIGPIAQTLDPTFQESNNFGHQTTPQPNTVQSVSPILISNTHIYNATYQQGFLIGGNVSVSYKDSFLSENAPTDVLNPSSANSLSVAYQQNLLRGFGIGVNARTINVSRLDLKASDLNFQTQVINTVASVLSIYYQLSADYDDLHAKQEEVGAARALYLNNQAQQRAGTLTPLDVVNAQAQLASSENDLLISQTTLQQHELQLKNLLSRTGTDPSWAETQIVPLDHIQVPEAEQLPPIADMVREALAKRPDLAAERLGIQESEISMLGTKNGVLPNLTATVTESDAGLDGNPRIVSQHGRTETADPFFTGGLSDSLGQLFRRNFPTNRASNILSAPLRNRQAQADYAIDQLSLRQQQLSTQKDLNQVGVDISNYAVALRQANARYQAAVHNRILEQQLLDGEQKRFAAGISTTYNVIVQQRDLATAQSTEVAALLAYTNARIALDQTLGTTLEVNHISLSAARTGNVALPAAHSGSK